MTPAARRRPETAEVPAVIADQDAQTEGELTATEPFNEFDTRIGVPSRYTIPPHTRVDQIPARILQARDIARTVRDEITLNPDIDIDFAAGVIGLANCIETICEVIA